MKKILALLITISMLLVACKKNDPAPKNEKLITSTDQLKFNGMFVSNVHPTSGEAKVYVTDSTKILQFEDFKTDAGQDLRVYLATDNTNSDFIELGKLKSTSGNFYYTLPSSTDLKKYSRVLIWCVDFSVLFGNSKLTEL
jgi:Electron transfer DM13